LVARDKRRVFTQTQKNEILYQQDSKCAFCHKKLDLRVVEYDHIKPWASTGRTITQNGAALCPLHHRIKTHDDRLKNIDKPPYMNEPKEVDNNISEIEFFSGMKLLINKVNNEYHPDYILAISSGGAIIGGILSRHLNIPILAVMRDNPKYEETDPELSKTITFPQESIKGKKILLVDDLVRSGRTLNTYYHATKQCNPQEIKSAVLLLAGEHQLTKPDIFIYKASKINIRMCYDVNIDSSLDKNT